MLDTANGESIADQSIDLFLGCLGEHISPLVLDSTPNVLSLGRRVVDDGYDWHWLGGTTTPWMVHPITREVVNLEYEDYCSFLADGGTTVPSSMAEAAAAKAPAQCARTVATAGVTQIVNQSSVPVPGVCPQERVAQQQPQHASAYGFAQQQQPQL